jgi:hypothetical protein
MKKYLKLLVRQIRNWPILGRFVRIIIALIRLPEERIQFQQHMVEHAVRMQNAEATMAATNARLNRHEIFIASQIPRLAQKVAELYKGTNK